MPTISVNKDDYEAVVELAGRMQMVLEKPVSLGRAAGHAARYLLSESKRVEKLLSKTLKKEER